MSRRLHPKKGRHTLRLMRHTGSKKGLKTLSIKVPQTVSAKVARLAKERSTTVSAVVRDAIERYSQPMPGSFGERAQKYIGSLRGGPGDLATNPKHLKGFGK